MEVEVDRDRSPDQAPRKIIKITKIDTIITGITIPTVHTMVITKTVIMQIQTTMHTQEAIVRITTHILQVLVATIPTQSMTTTRMMILRKRKTAPRFSVTSKDLSAKVHHLIRVPAPVIRREVIG